MTWKRLVVWLGLLLAVGWGVWIYRWFTLAPDERAGAYTSAPVCGKAAPAASCKERIGAGVGGKSKDSGYRRAKTYKVTLRATDAKVYDLDVYSETYDAVNIGDAVEIERWHNGITRLYHNGTEAKLPGQIRTTPSKGKLRAAFAFLLVASLWLVVKTVRARRRQPTTLA